MMRKIAFANKTGAAASERGEQYLELPIGHCATHGSLSVMSFRYDT